MADEDFTFDLTGVEQGAAEWEEVIAAAPPEKQEELRALLPDWERWNTHSKAKKTLGGYETSLRGWRRWCETYGQQPLPANPAAVAAYMTWLMQRGKQHDGEPLSLSTFKSLRSALNLEHATHYGGEEDAPPPPCDHPMVKRIIEGYTRTDAPGRKPAHVLTAEELHAMVQGCLTPVQTMDSTTLLAGLLIGSPTTSISGPQLEMLGHASYAAVTFEDQLDPAQDVAYLTLHHEAGRHDKVIVYPDPDHPDLCPVRALLAARLVREHGQDDAGNPLTGLPMLTNDNGKPITRQGIDYKVRKAFQESGGTNWSMKGWSTARRRAFRDSFEGSTVAGVRDAAMLLTGAWGGFRREEIADLDVGDVTLRLNVEEERDQIVELFVCESKTDQTRKGETVPVGHGFYGPGLSLIKALVRWLTAYEVALGLTTATEAEATLAAGRTPGSLLDPRLPLFPRVKQNDELFYDTVEDAIGTNITGDSVNDVYVKRATAAGVEANFGERLSSHGMRAAQTVMLAEQGVPLATANAMARRSDESSTGALYYRSARLSEATKPPPDPGGDRPKNHHVAETYYATGPD